MRIDGVATGAERAPRASGGRHFAAAMARVRARSTRPPSGTVIASAAHDAAGRMPAAVLARRRQGAEDATASLATRRADADGVASDPSGAPQPLRASATAESALGGAAALGLLLSPGAIERLVVEAGRLAGRPYVEMSFGPHLLVRLTQGRGGVDLVLEVATNRAVAQAELQGLVTALRARGVEVGGAEVRGGRGQTAGRPLPRSSAALTLRRASATTARAQQPHGTVAKW